ncbi:MAG: NADH-quinone oxidoreductase subunit NuoH [Myxococcota bacterium]
MPIDAAFIAAKIGFVFFLVLNLAGILGWVERKQSALMQDRIGANRAEIFGIRAIGLFHPLADAIKAFTKEDFIPARAHRLFHTLAPFIALVPALTAFAVIPFGNTLTIGGATTKLVIADLDVGILFVFAIMSLAAFGVVLAGWSSYNNYSLLGALRASAQMLSYEIVMGLTLVGVFMVYESLQLTEIARAQGEYFTIGGMNTWIPKWGILTQPLAFFLFLGAAVAESKRLPFDVAEAESELVAGYFTEYSGMKFLMFWMGEFVEIVVISALVTTLFLGGWQIPWLHPDGLHIPFTEVVLGLPSILISLAGVGAFLAKVTIMIWVQMTIRWTLPRFRYDQIMRLGWKMLLPLSLVNVVLTGLVVLALSAGAG